VVTPASGVGAKVGAGVVVGGIVVTRGSGVVVTGGFGVVVTSSGVVSIYCVDVTTGPWEDESIDCGVVVISGSGLPVLVGSSGGVSVLNGDVLLIKLLVLIKLALVDFAVLVIG